jgi:uncharacterized membrane protein
MARDIIEERFSNGDILENHPDRIVVWYNIGKVLKDL